MEVIMYMEFKCFKQAHSQNKTKNKLQKASKVWKSGELNYLCNSVASTKKDGFII